ncbi:hypothetical protein PANA5342_3196 [Pantoea ananatis LMG 5342]|nr:hypothetical protein PANA5342_3196 [Pantoea ananatis LMG 5342]
MQSLHVLTLRHLDLLHEKRNRLSSAALTGYAMCFIAPG